MAVWHPGGHAGLLKRVGKGQRVDDRGEHAHVVGAGTIHLAGRAPSPEVSAAHYNGDLRAGVDALFNAAAKL